MVRQRSIRVSDDFRKRAAPCSNCQASHYKFPVHPLLTLQKTSGNYAVQRLLRNRAIQAKLRQPGEVYEKEARLVVEQFMRAPTAAFGGGPAFPKCPVSKNSPVQRKSDGERNLESPRFTGDPLLEKILDGAEEMSREKNNSGPSVRKVQQALMDAGYSLPKFGADGKFGEETEGTLTIFQLTAGLDSGLNQGKGLADGVVRSQTILRLDQIFPSGAKPAGTPPPEKEDFLIKDKFQPSIIHVRRAQDPRAVDDRGLVAELAGDRIGARDGGDRAEVDVRKLQRLLRLLGRRVRGCDRRPDALLGGHVRARRRDAVELVRKRLGAADRPPCGSVAVVARRRHLGCLHHGTQRHRGGSEIQRPFSPLRRSPTFLMSLALYHLFLIDSTRGTGCTCLRRT